jgi:hypothetical protein
MDYRQRVHKDKRFTGAQTAQAIWTPASGNCIVLTDLTVTTDAGATLTVFVTSNAEGNRIVDGDFSANSGVAGPLAAPIQFAADAVLYFTSTAGNAKVVAMGYEVTG